MDFALSADQQLIKENVHALLGETAGPERRRKVLDSAAGWDDTLWGALAGEMGYAGLMIPESAGGSGLGAIEMAVTVEETGRVLAVVPFFETAVLATQAIMAAGTAAQQAALLPDLAAGRIRAAIALGGIGGQPFPHDVAATLSRGDKGWRLRGAAGFVSFAHIADLLLVIARAPGSSGREGISLVALRTPARGLHIERQLGLDRTRPFARIRFDDVVVPPESILGEPEAAAAAVQHTLAVAAGLLASEQTGGAAFCLAATVDYVKQRVQFGRPVGSFQAVKHTLADMMVRVEAARSAALYAAAAIDEGGEELAEAAAVARSWCCEAYQFCAAEAIQLHGGVGFTWDHHAHLYFKRARSSSSWLGEADVHREIIAHRMGLDDPP